MEEVKETLQPVVQASQILQARKSDKDFQGLCDICDKLSVQQVNISYLFFGENHPFFREVKSMIFTGALNMMNDY